MLMRATIALVVSLALLALPGAASAAKLERIGGLIRFTAGPGEQNGVFTGRSFSPEGWTVESRQGLFGPAIPPDLAGAPGCSTAGNTTTCSPDPAVTKWELHGLDGNDVLNTYWAASLVEGGDGNDQIETGDENDVLRGGPGDEVWLKANGGNDVLEGGGGSDRLFPGTGADQVFGGPGSDEVSYQYNSDVQPVSVTLDDVADDGVPGALANVHSDVEDILGGDGNDFLVGDADDNRLRGDLESLNQNGNDTLVGGGGRDTFEGGRGNDTLRARDGIAETVDCGADTDIAVVDTIDTPIGCETVDASAELEPDRDGDGFDAPADCDDHDAAIHPGVPDVPENGIDEDCADGDAQILDRDGDGFNRPQDCDDGNASIRPGTVDLLDNGIDEDCFGGDAINFDRDGDGVGRPQDCDDGNRAISPSIPERFGNAIDEDCSGKPDPYPLLAAEITSRWKPSARGTKAVRLLVSGAPVGALVTLRCKGPGCSLRTKRVKMKRAKDVALQRVLQGRRLKPGAVVEVRVTTDGMIGSVARFKIRDDKLPKRTSLCLAPGERRPRKC
jgi:Ca2+-binding RTX toxin-like protein